MVKSDRGEVRIAGTQNLVSAEISMLLQQYRIICIEEHGEKDGMTIFKATVDAGCKTIEEIRAENERYMRENPADAIMAAIKTTHVLLNL